MAIRKELIDELIATSGGSLIGPNGLVKELTAALVERMLHGELSHHLGYEKHEVAGYGTGNSRNGASLKTLKGEAGEMAIRVPRDRNGTFKPKLIGKHQTRFEGFDDKILSMYALGMTVRDIQSHLLEMYGVEVSPGLISEVGERIERFVMRASFESAKAVLDPILKSMDSQPREVQSIIQGLTVIEDSAPNTDHYWRLWLLFAGAVKSASWIGRLDAEHPWGNEVISAIFLTNYWKKTTRHWRGLEGHAHHVHELFEALPPSWCVLDSYVRFLYHIGEQSLPRSFIRIANKLKWGDARTLLSDRNTVFFLEVLLQRHVYGRPLELKQDKLLRESTLSILDTLVEAGSAASYRMRDDFVTPLSQQERSAPTG